MKCPNPKDGMIRLGVNDEMKSVVDLTTQEDLDELTIMIKVDWTTQDEDNLYQNLLKLESISSDSGFRLSKLKLSDEFFQTLCQALSEENSSHIQLSLLTICLSLLQNYPVPDSFLIIIIPILTNQPLELHSLSLNCLFQISSLSSHWRNIVIDSIDIPRLLEQFDAENGNKATYECISKLVVGFFQFPMEESIIINPLMEKRNNGRIHLLHDILNQYSLNFDLEIIISTINEQLEFGNEREKQSALVLLSNVINDHGLNEQINFTLLLDCIDINNQFICPIALFCFSSLISQHKLIFRDELIEKLRIPFETMKMKRESIRCIASLIIYDQNIDFIDEYFVSLLINFIQFDDEDILELILKALLTLGQTEFKTLVYSECVLEMIVEHENSENERITNLLVILENNIHDFNSAI